MKKIWGKSISSLQNREKSDTQAGGSVALIYIFKGDIYLGWDCFTRESITVGRSQSADLILDDPNISDVEAEFNFKKKKISVSGSAESGGVAVNGQTVKGATLKPFDFVTIGAYTLKVKVKSHGEKETISEKKPLLGKKNFKNVPLKEKSVKKVVENQPEDNNLLRKFESMNKLDKFFASIAIKHSFVSKKNAEEAFKKQAITFHEEKLIHRVGDILIQMGALTEMSRDLILLKQNRNSHKAPKMKVNFEKPLPVKTEKNVSENSRKAVSKTVDEPSLIDEIIDEFEAGTILNQEKISVQDNLLESIPLAEDNVKEKSLEKGTDVISDTLESAFLEPVIFEDDEEDDDDDETRSFLKGSIVDVVESTNLHMKNGRILEVIKLRDEDVLDVCFLREKEKYYISGDGKRFCLAENKDSRDCYFYFDKRFDGQLLGNNTQVNLSKLSTKENLHRKKNSYYRHPLAKGKQATLSDGVFNYVIRTTEEGVTPTIPEPPKKKPTFHKNLLQSTAFHVVALFTIGIFTWLKGVPTIDKPPEDKFVQFDISQLSPPPPKPIAKKKIAQAIVKVKPVKKKKIVKAKKVKKSRKKVASKKKRTPRASTKATSGNGKKGNVSNKNINETGIFAAIGIKKGINLGPSEAIAAVTNLDAVKSSRSVEGSFKVGGIVGKLGNGEIAVPNASIISTKGSASVLRSGGSSGVARLATGGTGGGEVQAMVTAKLNKSVRIRGGMSREAVKKVIDAHMDEISYCYETALMGNPSLMGKVIFEWKIHLSGKVGQVKTKSSSLKSKEIHSCIKSAIKSWQFPSPKGAEVVVSYPFIFDITGF